MAVDILTLAIAKKFTKETANALGAVKGAPCTIESIVDTGDANVVTFKWIGTDGTEQRSEMSIPHGLSHDEQTELLGRLDEVEATAKRAEETAKRAEENAGEDASLSASHDGQGNVSVTLTGAQMAKDDQGNVKIV